MPTGRSPISRSRRRRAARSPLSMSGGNQQKIVIGKWLNHGADLFIFDEPTVGVDVGTKAEIYRLFAALLEGGAGILLISSLPARGLRTRRHAACVPHRPASSAATASMAPATRSPRRGDRRPAPAGRQGSVKKKDEPVMASVDAASAKATQARRNYNFLVRADPARAPSSWRLWAVLAGGDAQLHDRQEHLEL